MPFLLLTLVGLLVSIQSTGSQQAALLDHARLRLLQNASAAHLHDEAGRQRAMRLLSRLRDDHAAAAAVTGGGDLERGTIAQELRHRPIPCRAWKPGGQSAAATSPRAECRRRSTSRWREALDVERRPGVADARGLGSRRHAAQRHDTARSGPHHPDEQRRGRCRRDRSDDEHGRRSHHRDRGRSWGRRGARREPDLCQQRSRLDTRCRRRTNAAGDEQGSAERTPQQHRRRPRWHASLRGHPRRTGCGRRDRYGRAAARQEHSRQRSRPQHVRDAGRPVRCCREHRRQERDDHRRPDRTNRVGHGFRSRRETDGVRNEPGRLDEAHVRPAHRLQWFRGRGLRDSQRSPRGSNCRSSGPARRRCSKGATHLTAWR